MMKKIKYRIAMSTGNVKEMSGKLFEADGIQFAVNKENEVTELSTGTVFLRESHNVNISIYTTEEMVEKTKEFVTANREKVDKAIDNTKELLKEAGISFPVNGRF